MLPLIFSFRGQLAIRYSCLSHDHAIRHACMSMAQISAAVGPNDDQRLLEGAVIRPAAGGVSIWRGIILAP
jgi:hypothetical protein